MPFSRHGAVVDCRPLDLFLGEQSRVHEDLDVGVFRRDIGRVLEALLGWEFFEASDGGLKSKTLRPRDTVDFEHVAPRLDTAAVAWLRDSLTKTSSGHPWIEALPKRCDE